MRAHLIVILLSPLILMAEETKSVSKPLILPAMPSLPAAGKNKPKVNLEMNCQGTDGQTYKSTDKGFEACTAQKNNAGAAVQVE